jgi:glycosyltransferase involved in cell wall biosynthesis
VLVTPGDASAIADAIKALLSDRESAATMGRAARLRVESDFGADRTARGWLDAYLSVAPRVA